LELKWLEDFLAVASSGNFSRAAEARNVTQPAFSRRLKALEMWIGVPLLDRSSYPITLTPAGEKLRPVAERVVRDLRASRDEARASSTVSLSMLKFAMPHSLAVDFFPMWWQTVNQAKAKVAAKVVADNLHDCVELLLQGGCQFLLCYRNDAVSNPVMSSDFSGIAIDSDALIAVSAPGIAGKPHHELVAGNSTSVPFLNYAPDAFLGKVTASLLSVAPNQFNLALCYESAFAEAVRAQTLAGAGAAWLPKKLIAADLNEGRLVSAGSNLPEAPLAIWLYRAIEKSAPNVESIWTAAKTLVSGKAMP
jgi:LysR family transcriptional regulator, hypochlorite-specific transcription factor HypT